MNRQATIADGFADKVTTYHLCVTIEACPHQRCTSINILVINIHSVRPLAPLVDESNHGFQ